MPESAGWCALLCIRAVDTTGAFSSDGLMVGILISGGTDFVYRVGDWDSWGLTPCRDYSRCESGVDAPTYCRHYDTSVSFPDACAASADSDGDNWNLCALQCRNSDGVEIHHCSGENIASIAPIIAYLEDSIPTDRKCTYHVVTGVNDGFVGLASGCFGDTITATLTLPGELVTVAGENGSVERDAFERDFAADVAELLRYGPQLELRLLPAATLCAPSSQV